MIVWQRISNVLRPADLRPPTSDLRILSQGNRSRDLIWIPIQTRSLELSPSFPSLPSLPSVQTLISASSLFKLSSSRRAMILLQMILPFPSQQTTGMIFKHLIQELQHKLLLPLREVPYGLSALH